MVALRAAVVWLVLPKGSLRRQGAVCGHYVDYSRRESAIHFAWRIDADRRIGRRFE